MLTIANFGMTVEILMHLDFQLCCFVYIETWILYRGKEQGVSKVVRDAYKRYEDMEFKTKASQTKISDEDRHVKLIRIAGEKVTDVYELKLFSFYLI